MNNQMITFAAHINFLLSTNCIAHTEYVMDKHSDKGFMAPFLPTCSIMALHLR